METNKQSVSIWVPITMLDTNWKGDISLPANELYELIIDYPLTNKAIVPIKTGKKGLSTIDLCGKIGKAYQKIYDEESRYGIWGHSIDDLSLQGISVNHKTKKITLSMGS